MCTHEKADAHACQSKRAQVRVLTLKHPPDWYAQRALDGQLRHALWALPCPVSVLRTSECMSGCNAGKHVHKIALHKGGQPTLHSTSCPCAHSCMEGELSKLSLAKGFIFLSNCCLVCPLSPGARPGGIEAEPRAQDAPAASCDQERRPGARGGRPRRPSQVRCGACAASLRWPRMYDGGDLQSGMIIARHMVEVLGVHFVCMSLYGVTHGMGQASLVLCLYVGSFTSVVGEAVLVCTCQGMHWCKHAVCSTPGEPACWREASSFKGTAGRALLRMSAAGASLEVVQSPPLSIALGQWAHPLAERCPSGPPMRKRCPSGSGRAAPWKGSASFWAHGGKSGMSFIGH